MLDELLGPLHRCLQLISSRACTSLPRVDLYACTNTLQARMRTSSGALHS